MGGIELRSQGKRIDLEACVTQIGRDGGELCVVGEGESILAGAQVVILDADLEKRDKGNNSTMTIIIGGNDATVTITIGGNDATVTIIIGEMTLTMTTEGKPMK